MKHSPLAALIIGLIKIYRVIPRSEARCRFHPTCSRYGLEAVAAHGAVAGGWLALKRIGRCHPWGGTGLDPVPPASVRGHRSRMGQVGTAAHATTTTAAADAGSGPHLSPEER